MNKTYRHDSEPAVYEYTYDDNGDVSTLPARTYTLSKFVEDDGDATDVSGENTLIQTIATAIWS